MREMARCGGSNHPSRQKCTAKIIDVSRLLTCTANLIQVSRDELGRMYRHHSERVKATGDTATAAKKARDEKVAAVRARSTIDSSDTTVRRWVELWVATADVRETTKETRRQVLAGLLDAIGERKSQALTADDVRNALDRMRREDYGSRTVQIVYEALSTALNVAASEDGIGFNPCVKLAKPKHVKRAYHAPYAEESRRLIEAARPGRERALVTLA